MNDYKELRDWVTKANVALHELNGLQCNECDSEVGYTCPVCLLCILAGSIKRNLPTLLADYDRLRQQCDELAGALEDVAKGSQDVKPEYYSGDNHGDSWDNGYEICHFELGQSARTALAKYREGK